MSAFPIPCVFTGEEFVPADGYRNIARQHYGAGEIVTLAPWEDRSDASHNHEFAWLRQAWSSLPDQHAESYPSPKHLRKRALIQAGYFEETVIDVGTNAGALRTAAAVQALDAFAYVIVRGGFVVVRRAESQSRRAMGGKRFQESKTAIMEIIAGMLGVEPNAFSSASSSAKPTRGDSSRDDPPPPTRSKTPAKAGAE